MRIPLILLMLFLPLTAYAGDQLKRARVIAVPDGDTIHIKGPYGVTTPLRLYGIDAPELKQPGGKEAQRLLEAMVGDRVISYSEIAETGDGIPLIALTRDTVSVNAAMVKAGHAWIAMEICSDKEVQRLKPYEDYAKKHKRGIWRDPSPQPPWDWREIYRENEVITVRWHDATSANESRLTVATIRPTARNYVVRAPRTTAWRSSGSSSKSRSSGSKRKFT